MVNESANPRSEADIETAYWVENEVLLRPLAGAVWLHKDDFEEVLLHQIAMHQTERRVLIAPQPLAKRPSQGRASDASAMGIDVLTGMHQALNALYGSDWLLVSKRAIQRTQPIFRQLIVIANNQKQTALTTPTPWSFL